MYSLVTLVEELLLGFFLRLAEAAQLLGQSDFANGKDPGLLGKFLHHPRLGLAHEGARMDKELPKTMAMRSLSMFPSKVVAASCS